jgi:hypothetical protein
MFFFCPTGLFLETVRSALYLRAVQVAALDLLGICPLQSTDILHGTGGSIMGTVIFSAFLENATRFLLYAGGAWSRCAFFVLF